MDHYLLQCMETSALNLFLRRSKPHLYAVCLRKFPQKYPGMENFICFIPSVRAWYLKLVNCLCGTAFCSQRGREMLSTHLSVSANINGPAALQQHNSGNNEWPNELLCYQRFVDAIIYGVNARKHTNTLSVRE